MNPVPITLTKVIESHPLALEYKLKDWMITTLEPKNKMNPFPYGPLHLSGVSAVRDKIEITGSAVSQVEDPIERAWFELLERAAIVNATQSKNIPIFEALDCEEKIIDSTYVFPCGTPKYSFSRSNGVAAFSTLSEALKRARLELIERDRVLRSWYGEFKPVPITPIESLFSKRISNDFHFYYRNFPTSNIDSDTFVAGIFGFPKKGIQAPFLYGFGSEKSLNLALKKAQGECLQRLGFLWGESFDGPEPVLKPSVDFHLEYFSRPRGVEAIRRWITEGHTHKMVWASPKDDIVFADLTPDTQKGKIWVVRALSKTRVPLLFGDARTAKGFLEPISEDLMYQPIA